MGRFADAVRTLLTPGWDSQLRRAAAELERQKAEVRTLTAELADNMEKFSMLLAREAKRRARAQKQLIDPDPDPAPAAAQAEPSNEREAKAAHKAELWRRAAALTGRKPSPEVQS